MAYGFGIIMKTSLPKIILIILAATLILIATAFGLVRKFSYYFSNSQSDFFENETVVAGGSGDSGLWILDPGDQSDFMARQIHLNEDVHVLSVASGGGRVFVSGERKDFFSDTKSGVYEVDVDSGNMTLILDTKNQAALSIHEILYIEQDSSEYLVAIGSGSTKILNLSDGTVSNGASQNRQSSSWASLNKSHVFRYDRLDSSIFLLELPSGIERQLVSGVSHFIPARSQSGVYFLYDGSWKFLDSSLAVRDAVDARHRDLGWAGDHAGISILINGNGQVASLLTSDIKRGTRFVCEGRTILVVDAGFFSADFLE